MSAKKREEAATTTADSRAELVGESASSGSVQLASTGDPITTATPPLPATTPMLGLLLTATTAPVRLIDLTAIPSAHWFDFVRGPMDLRRGQLRRYPVAGFMVVSQHGWQLSKNEEATTAIRELVNDALHQDQPASSLPEFDSSVMAGHSSSSPLPLAYGKQLIIAETSRTAKMLRRYAEKLLVGGGDGAVTGHIGQRKGDGGGLQRPVMAPANLLGQLNSEYGRNGTQR